MKKEIEIFTYFISPNSGNSSGTLPDKKNFSDWKNAEIYLKDRIQTKRTNEIFRVEIGEDRFGEMNHIKFNILQKIKESFLKLLQKTNAEKEKNIKSERIFVRVFPTEKTELETKAKEQNLTLSEFVRQSVLTSKVVQISNEEKRILNNASLNFNQFMRAINEHRKIGESISIDTINDAFKEWEEIAYSFRKLINKYESRNPKNDSEND